ncbi:hypothetical protein M758_3G110900 [Ceratodon purpureus]|nr:hypothetical protein M758_3G110900 [Ceratodon purpureus]
MVQRWRSHGVTNVVAALQCTRILRMSGTGTNKQDYLPQAYVHIKMFNTGFVDLQKPRQYRTPVELLASFTRKYENRFHVEQRPSASSLSNESLKRHLNTNIHRKTWS